MKPASALAMTLLLVRLVTAEVAAGNERIPWEALSETQQRVLSSVRDRWDGFDRARQLRLIEGVQAWNAMDAEQRQQARQRLKRWQSLAPEQRAEMAARLERFKALPPEQRERLRRTFERFRTLPLEQRRELRNKWQSMSPEERREAVRTYRLRQDASGGRDPQGEGRDRSTRAGEIERPQGRPETHRSPHPAPDTRRRGDARR